MNAHTLRPLRVVAVSGGQQSCSKSTVLAAHLQHVLAQSLRCESRLITLGPLIPLLSGATWPMPLPQALAQELAAVELADLLIVSTPVFRGSYTGMFKHFFDLLHQDALIDKPILLAATGGSQRHALMIEHQLRPLFSFFQARTLPLGVYAQDSDFEQGCLRNQALLARAQLAVQRALPVIGLACQQAALPHMDVAVNRS